MKIAMDIREAFAKNPAGKGLWTKRVLEELQKHPDIHLIQYPSNKSQKTNNYKLLPAVAPRGAKAGTTNNLRWHWKTARSIRKLKPDIYLSPTSYIVPWLLGKRIPVAIVIHDLIAFDHEPHDRKAKLIERLTLPKVLQTARWIFTVSEATREDLLKRFPKTDPKKITVVHAGPTIKLTTNNYQLTTRQKYILSIGTLCPRKNQFRLIQAFNALPDDLKKTHRLILAGGRGWDDEQIVALAKESENVEWCGYVPQEELTELLRNATLLAFPSLKEGFGFPVLDALAMGVPVLTSNRSSMKEIAGDAAMLVNNPESVEELSDALRTMLQSPDLREKMRQKGSQRAKEFSWERTVRKIRASL